MNHSEYIESESRARAYEQPFKDAASEFFRQVRGYSKEFTDVLDYSEDGLTVSYTDGWDDGGESLFVPLTALTPDGLYRWIADAQEERRVQDEQNRLNTIKYEEAQKAKEAWLRATPLDQIPDKYDRKLKKRLEAEDREKEIEAQVANAEKIVMSISPEVLQRLANKRK